MKMATLLVVMMSQALTSCASRPLAEPPQPQIDLLDAHVGVITSSDSKIHIPSWHGREISGDIAVLKLDFANRTFAQVSEIENAKSPPESVDLILDIGHVDATDTKNAMGWSADTTKITVNWVLSHRDSTPFWSGRFVGKATNRPGPVWNSLEKQNERIKIALQYVLAGSIAKIQGADVREQIQVATERANDIRQSEAETRQKNAEAAARVALDKQDAAEAKFLLSQMSPVDDFRTCVRTTVDTVLESKSHSIRNYDLDLSTSHDGLEGFIEFKSGAVVHVDNRVPSDAIYGFSQFLTDYIRDAEHSQLKSALENACLTHQ